MATINFDAIIDEFDEFTVFLLICDDKTVDTNFKVAFFNFSLGPYTCL